MFGIKGQIAKGSHREIVNRMFLGPLVHEEKSNVRAAQATAKVVSIRSVKCEK
jgi:hypothetical protein